MNNQGYHFIRMTQNKFFKNDLIGIGPESGDISFPDLSKLIPAYGINYYRIITNSEMGDIISKVFANDGPCLCELFLSTKQNTEPKVSSKKLSDGSMVSGRLDDMAPFLSPEEINEALIF